MESFIFSLLQDMGFSFQDIGLAVLLYLNIKSTRQTNREVSQVLKNLSDRVLTLEVRAE